MQGVAFFPLLFNRGLKTEVRFNQGPGTHWKDEPKTIILFDWQIFQKEGGRCFHIPK